MFSPDAFELIAERERQYFKQYLELIKFRVDDEKKKLDAFHEEVQKEKGNAQYDDMAEYLHNLAYEKWEFEQLMYKSFVVSVFIFIEDLATQLCIHLQRETKQSFSYKELAGNGVGRSINYLKKLLKEHPISDPKTLERFIVAQKVRNSLVHADGILKKEDLPAVVAFVKKYPEILEVDDQTRRVNLSYAYTESMLELLSKFTSELRKHWKETNSNNPWGAQDASFG